MSDDLPIPERQGPPEAEDVATVAWGWDDGPRRSRARRFFEQLRRDPRTAAVVAGLGAVATFAAFVGDWVIVTPPYSGPDGGPALLLRGIAELGNYAGGYLFGTFTLLGCLALLLFGSAGVRHNARMIGLAMAAATGAVLLAITVTMQESTRMIFDPNEGVEVAHGRGLVMAYVGTAAFAMSLLLAPGFSPSAIAGGTGTTASLARPTAAGAIGTEPVAESTGTPSGAAAAADAVPGWPWRRARGERAEPDGDGLPPPADLTVAPAPPFTRPEAPFTQPGPSAAAPDRFPPQEGWPDHGRP